MFKKSKHWTKSKNINSKRYKTDLANYLDGRSLKCVTERVNGIEEVIGHKGAIIKKEDELLVYASQEYLADQYTADADRWGEFDEARWSAFFSWLNENNLLEGTVEPTAGFTNDYLPGGNS